MGKSGANERNESSLSNCRVQPALSKKEGRVDFRKNLRLREDWWVFENFAFQKLFQSIFPFLYHSTMTLAFSSQESSICLSLQFSERSFSKDLSFSSSLSNLAKSRAD